MSAIAAPTELSATYRCHDPGYWPKAEGGAGE
jgi:hypothetical protein